MTKYELGNSLRGYFSGQFETDEEAWNILSERFNNAYPSRCGREVELKKTILIKTTKGGNETVLDRTLREKLEEQQAISVFGENAIDLSHLLG